MKYIVCWIIIALVMSIITGTICNVKEKNIHLALWLSFPLWFSILFWVAVAIGEVKDFFKTVIKTLFP